MEGGNRDVATCLEIDQFKKREPVQKIPREGKRADRTEL
jgi:hypothetical protein